MSWSYSGNPGQTPKDAVRFLIGDTDICDQLLQDGEIYWLLSQYNNAPLNAAIRCVETIIAKYSRLADESVGQVRISFSQKSKSYRTLLNDLRNRLATDNIQPFAGGISVSDMETVRDNNDRVRPSFSRHMMENEQISPWVANGPVEPPVPSDEGN